MKHYYALLNEHGRIHRESFNRCNGYVVYRFASKLERDEFVSENESELNKFGCNTGKTICWSATRAEANYETFNSINKIERDADAGFWTNDSALILY